MRPGPALFDAGFERHSFGVSAVLLRDALSSPNSAFVKLVWQGLPATLHDSESAQVSRGESQPYRQNRKLSPTDLKELCELYEAGSSMVQLAEKFECHRHTVMRLLKKAGVEIRPQRKMTTELVARATALYAQDHSLEELGRLLGLEASTIGKALKRAGVTLRSPVADRWSRDD